MLKGLFIGSNQLYSNKTFFMDYLSKTQLETPHMMGKNLLIILQVKNSLDIHYYTIT